MKPRTSKKYAGYPCFPPARPVREFPRPKEDRPNTNIEPLRFADVKSVGVPFSEVFLLALAVITGLLVGGWFVYMLLSKSVV